MIHDMHGGWVFCLLSRRAHAKHIAVAVAGAWTYVSVGHLLMQRHGGGGAWLNRPYLIGRELPLVLRWVSGEGQLTFTF